MSRDAVIQSANDLFQVAFGGAPTTTAYAPGRVNLLGEHTDYNGGLVFPMPLALGTAVAVSFGGPKGKLDAVSGVATNRAVRHVESTPNKSWSDYLVGSLTVLFDGDLPDQGLRIAISSDLPTGSGLSSSAAIEVALMRAVCALTEREISPVDIALLARRAENEYVGMPCGIMDQYSVSVGSPGKAVFLDTRALQSEVVDLPDSHNFIIIHSGVPHKLTEDGYEKRVEECNSACAALGIDMLSDLDIDSLDRIQTLSAPLDARARHIFTENDRVKRALEALRTGNLDDFARFMVESHASQRDDYAVSVPEVDALVQGAIQVGADGARLTGGGFGGSIVAFVQKPRVSVFIAAIEERFQKARILAVT